MLGFDKSGHICTCMQTLGTYCMAGVNEVNKIDKQPPKLYFKYMTDINLTKWQQLIRYR